MEPEITSIAISKETRKRIKRIAGVVDETYDGLINKALDSFEQTLQYGGSEDDWERKNTKQS